MLSDLWYLTFSLGQPGNHSFFHKKAYVGHPGFHNFRVLGAFQFFIKHSHVFSELFLKSELSGSYKLLNKLVKQLFNDKSGLPMVLGICSKFALYCYFIFRTL